MRKMVINYTPSKTQEIRKLEFILLRNPNKYANLTRIDQILVMYINVGLLYAAV